jgi:hypothetical protein
MLVLVQWALTTNTFWKHAVPVKTDV